MGGRVAHAKQNSDVFSFGVLLFEIFERAFPWQHVEKRSDVIHNIVSGVHLPQQTTRYPPGLAQWIVAACWRLKPEERPLMDDVVRKLKECAATVGMASSSGSHAPAPAPLPFVGGIEERDVYDEPLSFAP